MVQPLLDEAQVGQDSFQLQQQRKRVEQGSLGSDADLALHHRQALCVQDEAKPIPNRLCATVDAFCTESIWMTTTPLGPKELDMLDRLEKIGSILKRRYNTKLGCKAKGHPTGSYNSPLPHLSKVLIVLQESHNGPVECRVCKTALSVHRVQGKNRTATSVAVKVNCHAIAS